jgi:hypothetical protein
VDKFLADFRMEELKSLQQEISYLVKDSRSLEIYVTGALAAYYAWLFTHCSDGLLFPWLVPIAAPCIGAWRSNRNLQRLMQMGTYIRDCYPTGWEDYVERVRRHDGDKNAVKVLARRGSHVAIWFVLFAGSIVIAAYAGHSKNLSTAGCHQGVSVEGILPIANSFRSVKL